MRQTVVGVFDRFAAAQHAAELLQQRGIDSDDIHVTAADDGGGTTSSEPHEEGLLDKIKNFFSGAVDDDFEVSAYSEHVRRGGAVVKVDIEDEPQVEMAREALQSAGAVDIDERVSEWKAGGWSGADNNTQRSTVMAAGSLESRADRQTERSEGEQVIPVVKEEVQVGKRTVKAGGVRVYARTVEDQVHESLELREERARVERRPVDRAASEADFNALKDRTIEVEEMVERPVVQKTARVVEEVVVGKDVRQKTANVDETVRRTEVEVENLGGDQRSRAYESFDKDFRSDFSTRFGSSGRQYEDYEPAYRFGHSLGSNPRYAGRDWDDVEADARTEWGRSNSGSTWEDMKAAVRHAWERVKS
jgi:stress response protein YsnF